MASLFVLGSLALRAVIASPVLEQRQSITTLSATQINDFARYSWYARAGYCEASLTAGWTCGTACQANPNFVPVASGGDGDTVQFWYAGYDPNLNSVIVAHQGTDTSEIIPILEDGDIVFENLDSTLFPGVSSSVEVHSGFAHSQAAAATTILAAVKNAMATHSTSSITTVGHSLGGAIALLDGVFFELQIPTATVSVVAYGLPRVGNQAWANYVDAHLNVSHVNNKEDIVPILPGMFLGYHHPSGEKHIMDSGVWVACPGQDNPSDECIVGDVPTIFNGDTSDHDGPYNGVTMGTC